jgi:hypothetical protein
MSDFLAALSGNMGQYDGLMQAGQMWKTSQAAARAGENVEETRALRKEMSENTRLQQQQLHEMQQLSEVQKQQLILQQQQFEAQENRETEIALERKQAAEFRKLLAFSSQVLKCFDNSQ